ncbi:unnamed protein product [Strongylus vulgaris]|uniref:Lipoyl-binding domain-containing protein n=1 Tax=Strongylus vulgaris TaxID=40348 RepID=A0A3P7KG60_STRVU|nr:unnamed protein product [Strongylus vulgaris]
MQVSFDGKIHLVRISNVSADDEGMRYTLEFDGRRWKAKGVRLQHSALILGLGEAEYELFSPDTFQGERAADGSGMIHSSHAPMPGIIEKVLVKVGDEVRQGEPLVIMTAMKMEYIIR